MSSRDESNPAFDGNLLDRLTEDDEPGSRLLPESKARRQQRRLESIRRDVEVLLNTRRSCLHRWDELDLENSLLNLGLPDPTGQRLASRPERAAFLREVEQAIRTFEPRITNVAARLQPEPDEGDRTLRFEITGRLATDGSDLVFDSAFEPLTAQIRLRRGGS